MIVALLATLLLGTAPGPRNHSNRFSENYETFSDDRSFDHNVGAPSKMNMILSAGEIRWPEPVYLRIGYGMPEAIRSPKEAHNHLLFRWPATRGEKYSSARSVCLEADADPLLYEKARKMFIEACIEASVLD
jgi:hypothetical protein